MIIDADLCIGCEDCITYCPVAAISMDGEHATVDAGRCTECNNCFRAGVCPVDAIVQNEMEWPRSIRNIFSDPISVCKETGVSGRGTEESKTNDITNRFKSGEVGFAVDVGRPNAGGVKLKEVEEITTALAGLNLTFDPDNPLTYLMEDHRTGKLKAEVLAEMVISAIIEFRVPLDRCADVVKTLEGIGRRVDTVFSVGVISRVEDNGRIPARDAIEAAGYRFMPNGKTTLALGRPAK
ncbi:MAG: 4Fe-4S dicluster-binding protein [Thermodesulfobacteriota bacterium]